MERDNRYTGNRKQVSRPYVVAERNESSKRVEPESYPHAPVVQPPTNTAIVQQPTVSPIVQNQDSHKKAGGLAQTLGLDPRIALIAVVLDTMLFAGEIATFGVLIFFSIVAGVIFGFVTLKAQIAWYEDDRDSALIKALIMGLLTAIPSPLPAFLYVPAGVIGAVKKLRGN